MSPLLEPSIAQRAQEALARHAWHEAWELMSEADRGGSLTPDELIVMSDAAWWVGKLPASIDALERAYALAQKAGRPDLATMAAIRLGRSNVLRNQHAVATAWLRRAEHLIEGLPENAAHGWLAVVRSFQAGVAGPVETTLAQAAIATDIAKRQGDRNLAAMAMSCQGIGLVMSGRAEEGMALLDEAAVAAVAGELDPETAGSVSCATIGACASMGDWTRALQWTEAQDRWCEREHINGYPGMCRLYRSEIKSLRGLWLEAEAEARRASEELLGFVPAAAGLALYQVGELRLRRGDLPAAEEALLGAHALGRAEPAFSLLRLAQGNAAAAFDSISRALSGTDTTPSWHSTPNSASDRASLLPAFVEIAIAAGDHAAAADGATELQVLADRFGTSAMRARAAAARAAVSLATGQPSAAVDAARQALAAWRELSAPWETARVRTLLAEALAADGALEQAALELRPARSVFEQLEAVPDLRRVDELLREVGAADGGSAASAPTRVLRSFCFTDIVESTRLAESLGDETWDRLLRWHDRTIRRLLAEHGGEEVKRTGDGFFVAFDDPDRAIEFAVSVQRDIAQPPPDLGAELAVRIGIHQAEANRSGLDYVGSGVNVAARVTGEAGTGEILVSHSTLDALRRRWLVSAPREVRLRGVSEPVQVVAVDWRPAPTEAIGAQGPG
jgi:class 3 adenylate cyclase